ncbi:hypothetical protein CSUI_003061 [Cystoisospora suis]|uniref:Uncharacterized protein n=1 Tax=Cystoisospora suis TaxID=483139 RepID=A0A2C6KRQ8_9APIC|nr:hypothetical protein CSUI_003061 [Cystoisospora suis]
MSSGEALLLRGRPPKRRSRESLDSVELGQKQRRSYITAPGEPRCTRRSPGKCHLVRPPSPGRQDTASKTGNVEAAAQPKDLGQSAPVTVRAKQVANASQTHTAAASFGGPRQFKGFGAAHLLAGGMARTVGMPTSMSSLSSRTLLSYKYRSVKEAGNSSAHACFSGMTGVASRGLAFICFSTWLMRREASSEQIVCAGCHAAACGPWFSALSPNEHQGDSLRFTLPLYTLRHFSPTMRRHYFGLQLHAAANRRRHSGDSQPLSSVQTVPYLRSSQAADLSNAAAKGSHYGEHADHTRPGWISRTRIVRTSRLETFGLGSVALKHATVPQLLAIAWALNQWDLVVEVVRLHDKRRRCQTSPRKSRSPPPNVGSVCRTAVVDVDHSAVSQPSSCDNGESAANPVPAQQPISTMNPMFHSSPVETSLATPGGSIPCNGTPLVGESRDRVLSIDRLLELMQAMTPTSQEARSVARELLKELLRCVRLGVISTPPPAIYAKLVEAAQCLGLDEDALDTGQCNTGQ